MSYTNKKRENGKSKIQQPLSLTFPSQLLKVPIFRDFNTAPTISTENQLSGFLFSFICHPFFFIVSCMKECESTKLETLVVKQKITGQFVYRCKLSSWVMKCNRIFVSLKKFSVSRTCVSSYVVQVFVCGVEFLF